jgi:hypothetical protein
MSPTGEGGGGGGCGVLANESSCAHVAQINFGYLTLHLTDEFSAERCRVGRHVSIASLSWMSSTSLGYPYGSRARVHGIV